MFITTPSTLIKETITEAYQHDDDLIDKWLNVAGSGLEACIDDQVKALTAQPTFEFYRVEEDGKLAGYFGREMEGEWMSTIFIIPELRPRKKEFWKEVQHKMNPVFKCAGFLKNQPACRFYAKFGKQIGELETPHGPAVMFEFRS